MNREKGFSSLMIVIIIGVVTIISGSFLFWQNLKLNKVAPNPSVTPATETIEQNPTSVSTRIRLLYLRSYQ